MLRRSTSTRTAAAVLAAGLGLSIVAVAAPAGASTASTGSLKSAGAVTAPAALQMNGDYSAGAEASLLTLEVPSISPALLPQTNVNVADSAAHAESGMDVDGAKAGAQRTGAVASTTGTGLFGTNVLSAPLDLQTTEASAPASEAHSDTLLPLDLSPLLDLPVIHTEALANWVSDTECVAADTPLSKSDQSLADLTLLSVAAGQSVAELDTDAGDGAANTEASTQLISIPGQNDPRAVAAKVETDVSDVNVLNGLAGPGSAIGVHAVQTPHYTVSASGIAGGAKVEGADPAVEVDIAGQPLITLDTANQTKDATITDLVLGDLLDLSNPQLVGDLLDDLGLGALKDTLGTALDQVLAQALSAVQPIVRLSIPVDKETSPDGTHASVAASLLRVEVLLPTAVGATQPLAGLVNQILQALGAKVDSLLTLDVGPVGAEVKAPVGGLTCGEPNNPLRELTKHASAAEVAPGASFEYVISVPNRGECTLHNVTVTDTVSGPSGFSITDTEPDATVAGNKATWNLGDLAPNQTKNLTITVKVPANAKAGQSFDDVVTASGTCDGRTVTKDDRVDDIPVVKTDFSGPCNVQFSNKDASHIQVTPGETFSYYVHAFNSGGEACSNVKVTDKLDSRLSFVSCNKSCVNDPADTVSWSVPSIPGGGSVTLAVVVKVADNAKGTLANSAIITPSNGTGVTVKTTGPVIGADSIPKRPAAATRAPLPKTGSALPAGLGVLLAGGAMALLALRRRAAVV
jgi:uncharacterized repeat protein (TIGR01451 family)